MSVTYWTTLIPAAAFCSVLLRCAISIREGGRSAVEPKAVIATKSDRLAVVVQPAYRYITAESRLLVGSRLSLVTIGEPADHISRAN
jgi:hypothetical protein